jgi:hypothetical protein
MTQPAFTFARAADTSRAQQYADHVITLLSDGSWRRAKAICAAIPGLTDRSLRMIAEQSRGSILGGQKGYCLTKYASNDEIDRCERWLLSQADSMRGRAVEIRKARNSGGVAA